MVVNLILTLFNRFCCFTCNVLQTFCLLVLFCHPEEISSIDEQRLKIKQCCSLLSRFICYKITKSMTGSFDQCRTTASLNSKQDGLAVLKAFSILSSKIRILFKQLYIVSSRVLSFGMIRIRINDPRSLGSWCIKGTVESFPRLDSLARFEHDPSNLGSLALIRIIPKRTYSSYFTALINVNPKRQCSN